MQTTKESKKELKYMASRVAFIHNYVLAGLIVVFLVILFQTYNLKFTFAPQTSSEFWSMLLVLIFFIAIVYLIEEPSMKRIIEHYLLTNDELVRVVGIIRKNRISIPYDKMYEVRVEKNMMGRVFNFGNVHIAGIRGNTVMKYMHNPDEIYRIIQNKINLNRKSATIKSKESE
jgi:membrane protein YdbS with pleckstrin-like domain